MDRRRNIGPRQVPAAGPLYRAALERAKGGDLRGALRVVFDLLRVEPFHADGLARAAELAEQLGSARDAAQFRALLDDPGDAVALYDVGFSFVGSGMPELGVRYLERCLTLAPGEPRVRYELGYAYFLSGDYKGAIPLLEATFAETERAGPEPLAAGLLLVECLLYAGRAAAALEAFERVEVRSGGEAEAEVDALAGLLARAAILTHRKNKGPRDWHFIEHGGAVLHIARSGPGQLVAATASIDFLAGMVRRLEGFLVDLGHAPGQVAYARAELAPFAAALAERLSVPAVALAERAPARALLVLGEPGEATPHLSLLREHEEGLDLFALYLDPRREYPILPDVVGQFAARLELPGNTAAEQARIAAAIAEAAHQIEGDEGDRRALARYYGPLRELLVLGNYERYPARRMCTARRAHA